jgi:hypothetical protein
MKDEGPLESYMDESIAMLDLARSAQRLFAAQEPRKKNAAC